MAIDTTGQDCASAQLSDTIAERRVLMGLTYRLLGSVTDAEDAVQETFMRWYRLSEHERCEIQRPRAWLITTASRVALDMLKSARVRREQYVGDWLPEPVPDAATWTSQGPTGAIDPSDQVTLDESLSMAVLVVLETMTPAERVAFVLHDVFQYTFPEISQIIGRTPAACRQLASSARRRVRNERKTAVREPEHDVVVQSFKNAWQTGDMTALLKALDPNATAVIDGGGLVSAAQEPLHGPRVVSQFFLDVYSRQPDLRIDAQAVNGQLGLVATDALGEVLAVITISTAPAGRIDHLWVMRNPTKLALWRLHRIPERE